MISTQIRKLFGFGRLPREPGAGGSSVLANMASKLNLGSLGNVITGALCGVGGGNLLSALLTGGGAAAAANAAGGLDLGSIVT